MSRANGQSIGEGRLLYILMNCYSALQDVHFTGIDLESQVIDIVCHLVKSQLLIYVARS